MEEEEEEEDRLDPDQRTESPLFLFLRDHRRKKLREGGGDNNIFAIAISHVAG